MAETVTDKQIIDQKTLALRIKGVIGHRLWRLAIRPVVFALKMVPVQMLYNVGLKLRRDTYPYCVIKPGDTVVQIGAPSDLLRIGRSRSIFFSMLVGPSGRMIIIEPETSNVHAVENMLARLDLDSHTVVIPKGAWSTEKTLRFYSNPDHPASAVLEDVADHPEAKMKAMGYVTVDVPVTMVDAVLEVQSASVPSLISITTNGAEEEILKGATNMLKQKKTHIAVAHTGPGLEQIVASYEYSLVARDDRGFTFEPKIV